MPNVNEIYQGQFLNAAQLKGAARRVTIEGATVEVLGQGERAQKKIVLKLNGVKARLPLNKTNATLLASTWGPETTNWAGHVIELYPQKVMFQGMPVDSIRVSVPPLDGAPRLAAVAPPAAKPAPSAEQTADDGDGIASMPDDVPW